MPPGIVFYYRKQNNKHKQFVYFSREVGVFVHNQGILN